MCVIIQLLPGKSIEHTKLYNAACNNWHSWGLIIKNAETQSLEVHKKLPPNGVYEDIDEIKKLLDDNLEHERIIHFRWASKGLINDDNTHPFLFFKDETRECYLMHNGTFSSLGNHSWSGNVKTENPNSDTKEFVDKYLKPSAGEFVRGDYTNKIYQEMVLRPIIKDKGGMSSRLILVANDLPTMREGSWTTYSDTETNEPVFYASNSDYFDKIERGPIFTKLEEEEKRRKSEEEEKKKRETPRFSKMNTTGTDSINEKGFSDFQMGLFSPNPEIISGIKFIMDSLYHDNGDLDNNDLSNLNQLTSLEMKTVVRDLVKDKKEDQIAEFILFLCQGFSSLYTDYIKLQRKKKSSESKIIELKTELQAAQHAA